MAFNKHQKMKSIAVLISGRGSNLLNLLENAKNYKIIAVYSNRADALGLEHAKKFQIPYFVFAKDLNFTSKEQKIKLFEHIENLNPDLIALAGFMSIVPATFTQKFARRIINIHPALLPKFPGLDTHQRAIDANETEHGCTVHYVDEGIDTGEIIAQASCQVLPNDTEAILASRVLKLEHEIYPKVLNKISA